MAYKQKPGRGKCSPFKAVEKYTNSPLKNGDGDDKKTKITTSRDDEGLLTVTTTTRQKSSGGSLTSSDQWNKFLSSPEGELYSQKKKERKEITQVPIKPAISVDSDVSIRDVKGVTPVQPQEVEEKYKQKRSSSKSRRKKKPKFKQKKQKLFSTKMKTSCKIGQKC
jgi:hypothetical protein